MVYLYRSLNQNPSEVTDYACLDVARFFAAINPDASDKTNPHIVFDNDCNRIENPHLFEESPSGAPKTRDNLTYYDNYFERSRQLITNYADMVDESEQFRRVAKLSNLAFARFLERVNASRRLTFSRMKGQEAYVLARYDSGHNQDVSHSVARTLYSLFVHNAIKNAFAKRGVSEEQVIGISNVMRDLFRELRAPLIRPEYSTDSSDELTKFDQLDRWKIIKQLVWRTLFSDISSGNLGYHPTDSHDDLNLFYQGIGRKLLSQSGQFINSDHVEVLGNSTIIIGEIAYAIFEELFLNSHSSQLTMSF